MGPLKLVSVVGYIFEIWYSRLNERKKKVCQLNTFNAYMGNNPCSSQNHETLLQGVQKIWWIIYENKIEDSK